MPNTLKNALLNLGLSTSLLLNTTAFAPQEALAGQQKHKPQPKAAPAPQKAITLPDNFLGSVSSFVDDPANFVQTVKTRLESDTAFKKRVEKLSYSKKSLPLLDDTAREAITKAHHEHLAVETQLAKLTPGVDFLEENLKKLVEGAHRQTQRIITRTTEEFVQVAVGGLLQKQPKASPQKLVEQAQATAISQISEALPKLFKAAQERVKNDPRLKDRPAPEPIASVTATNAIPMNAVSWQEKKQPVEKYDTFNTALNFEEQFTKRLSKKEIAAFMAEARHYVNLEKNKAFKASVMALEPDEKTGAFTLDNELRADITQVFFDHLRLEKEFKTLFAEENIAPSRELTNAIHEMLHLEFMGRISAFIRLATSRHLLDNPSLTEDGLTELLRKDFNTLYAIIPELKKDGEALFERSKTEKLPIPEVPNAKRRLNLIFKKSEETIEIEPVAHLSETPNTTGLASLAPERFQSQGDFSMRYDPKNRTTVIAR